MTKTVSSKRQLVYRLDLWKIRKYNNTGERSEGGEPTQVCSDDQHEDEDGSSAEDSGDNYGNITPPEVVANPIIPLNGDGEAEWRIRKANVLLAMCFHEWSWPIFNDDGFGFGDLRNLAALARAAETVEQCNFTLEVMKQQFWLRHGSSEVLYRFLLTLLVRDSKKNALERPRLGDPPHDIKVDPNDVQEKGPSEKGPSGAVLAKLNEVGDFLIKLDGGVDMIAYILLYNLRFRHQNLLPSPESQELVRSMLYGFNPWSGTDHQIEIYKPVEVLVECLEWCQKHLQHVCNGTTGRSARLDLALEPGHDQELWRDHIEVFGTLWAALEMEHSYAGGQWPEWASKSVGTFNLSHAEVLACVCWMMAKRSGNTLSADGQAFASSLLAAEQIAKLPALGLWEDFRQTFVTFNEPTLKDTDENRDFKAAVVNPFLKFIDETLGAINSNVVGVVGGGGGGFGDGGGMGGDHGTGGGHGTADSDGSSQNMFIQMPTDYQIQDFMSQRAFGDMMSQCAPQEIPIPAGTTFMSSPLQPI